MLAIMPRKFGLTEGDALIYARNALEAAYPELANDAAWVAPMEATISMMNDADVQRSRGMHSQTVWNVMRDAFLQEPKDAK